MISCVLVLSCILTKIYIWSAPPPSVVFLTTLYLTRPPLSVVFLTTLYLKRSL
jgi:hypothetical protein